MSQLVIDLRSDTVTKPTPEMRAAMARAAVGDDVFEEDPTVLELQERIADMLGMEAAIFVPSGTMSNQIAVQLHCQSGDEFLCEAQCHLFGFEQAAYAQLSGVAARPLDGHYGVIQREQLEGTIRPADDHYPYTRMLALENTHNRGGGRIQPYDVVTSLCAWAHTHKLTTHLDGSRLLNAVVETGIAAPRWAQHFDTVNVCFSKGLGAPVGSALAGRRDWIRRARRHRKALGGGMRQAGILAAGALYALEHHVERLREDHAKARRFAQAVAAIKGLNLAQPEVQTNIVMFEVAAELGTAADLVQRCRQQGLRMLAIAASRVRAVTHLDVGPEHIDQAAEILEHVARKPAAAGSLLI
jgi:threonine aldolase